MPNLTSVGISSGVPNSGTGTVSTIDALMADGGQATLGAKADAKSTATDTTAISAISIWKQISASVQLLSGTGSATDRSGTITLGGTAQNAMASNSSRKGWALINNSDTVMYVHPAGTASATAGIPAYPNDMVFGYEVNAISLFCATTGKAFTAWEYS